MIPTRGLTHIALKVADLDRTIAFYCELLGSQVLVRNGATAEIGTPGAHDVITLEQTELPEGASFGTHIGFRLIEPITAEEVARAVTAAGGTVAEQGEFGPGLPYVFARDPDGYEIELWFEPANPNRPE